MAHFKQSLCGARPHVSCSHMENVTTLSWNLVTGGPGSMVRSPEFIGFTRQLLKTSILVRELAHHPRQLRSSPSRRLSAAAS